MSKRLRGHGALCALLTLGMLLGLPFVSLLGPYNDEAFSIDIFYPSCASPVYSWTFGHFRLPVMVLTYLGSLKGLIYWPLLRMFQPSLWLIRLPMIAVGALTAGMLYSWLNRTAGRPAAIFGAALLVTDASFQVFTVADFTSALPHVFLLGVILPLARPEPGVRQVALAGFLAGLGMWDKALFSWLLAGLTGATLIAYRREALRACTPRNLAAAAGAFAVGASPFLIYNAVSGFAAYRANTYFQFDLMPYKAMIARRTLDGSIFLGFGTHEAETQHLRLPSSLLEKFSVGLANISFRPEHNWMAAALLIALLIMPWAGMHRRKLAFGFVFLSLTWLQMAITRNAGAAAHHVLLLWPVPAFCIALAWDSLRRRAPQRKAPLAILAVAICLWNGLVLNRIYASLIAKGTSPVYTEAVLAAIDFASRQKGRVFLSDWGVTDTLCLWSEGATVVSNMGLELSDARLTPADGDLLNWAFANPEHVFLNRTYGSEIWAGRRERLLDLIRQRGYAPIDVQVFYDRNGRPRFDAFRLRRSESGRPDRPATSSPSRPRP